MSLLEETKTQLLKSIEHLEWSFKKVKSLNLPSEKTDNETLETWESFSSRFSRSSDLFVSKYLRSWILQKDPGFEGTVIDSLNYAEKHALIASADEWRQIRAMRNFIAHEYSSSEIGHIYSAMIKYCPTLLALKDKI